MRPLRAVLVLSAIITLLSTLVFAVQPDSIRDAIDSSQANTSGMSFQLDASVPSISLPPGAISGNTVDLTVTDTGNTGFLVGNAGNITTVLPLTYTCAVSPSAIEGPTCTFSPSSTTNASSVTVAIVTQPSIGKLTPPLGRSSRIFYAMLLPGLFGIVLALRSRSRGVRMLGLMVVFGCFTLGLTACGRTINSSQKNPGTPPGNYTIVVSATTGGASPIAASAPPIALTVQ